MRKSNLVLILLLLAITQQVHAQEDFKNPPLAYYLNKEKTRYIKFGGSVQFWARYTEMNPGSKVNESEVDNIADFSLRRLRMKIVAVPLERVMLVLQVGNTNGNNLSKTDNFLDVLDIYAEYRLHKFISIGGGRSNWTGVSRFASGPTKGLMYETPLVNLGNVNRTDNTQRKLSVYAKGQISRLDYRFVLANPYQLATGVPQKNVAAYNNKVAKPNLSGYVKWQFLDKESNLSAVNAGTYLGKKKILNIGIGGEYQAKALWHLDGVDTVTDNMQQWCLDLFYDTPIDTAKGTAFTFYAAGYLHRFGPNYTRILAIDNPANGVAAKGASFNGSGNGYPVVGTGNTLLAQAGFLLPYFNKKNKCLQLLPAAGIQYSRFDRLADPMITYDGSLSLLMKGHSSKLVFNAQSRPVYNTQSDGAIKVTARKMMYVLMYQLALE